MNSLARCYPLEKIASRLDSKNWFHLPVTKQCCVLGGTSSRHHEVFSCRLVRLQLVRVFLSLRDGLISPAWDDGKWTHFRHCKVWWLLEIFHEREVNANPFSWMQLLKHVAINLFVFELLCLHLSTLWQQPPATKQFLSAFHSRSNNPEVIHDLMSLAGERVLEPWVLISLRENDESRGDKTPLSFVESPDEGSQTAAGFFYWKNCVWPTSVMQVSIDFISIINPPLDINAKLFVQQFGRLELRLNKFSSQSIADIEPRRWKIFVRSDTIKLIVFRPFSRLSSTPNCRHR